MKSSSPDDTGHYLNYHDKIDFIQILESFLLSRLF